MTLMARVPAPKPRASVIETTRVAKGMTRRALAEEARTTYSTVYNIEVGHNPRVGRELLRRIADALEVDVTSLIEPETVEVSA